MAILAGSQLAAQTPDTAPDFATVQLPAVFIVSPADGETVSSPVTVHFGARGITLAPAGTFKPGTGHQHLLIDTELGNPNVPIPSNAHFLHFGKAQTQATIELSPGQHTLQLVLGDGNHIAHDPPVMSKRITIRVR